MKTRTLKMLALSLTLAVALSAVPALAAPAAPAINWKGEAIAYTQGPVTQSSALYVPLDETMTAIGATATVAEGSAAIAYGGKHVTVPVTEIGAIAYVPVRALFEGLGYEVVWSPEAVNITLKKVDEYSFSLGNFDGTVGAFCDVIMTEAKLLAFSDPFYPADEEVLTSYVSKKCENYGVKYYIEKNLLLTKLFADVDMEGAWVYILYKDDAVLDQYLALQKEETDLKTAGTYTEKAQIDLATRYGKLMGYSDKVIADMVAGD